MKHLLILLSICLGGIQSSKAQFVALNSSEEFPELFNEYTHHDSMYHECLQSWTTNYEWAECNGAELQYWKKQMHTGYEEVLQSIDSSARNEFTAYHEAWLKNIEGQVVLFDKLRKDVFSGREQILTFNGIIARQYAEHAKDLRYLAYMLSLN